MGQFSSTPVCTTPACVNTASSMLSNLAPHWKEVDPCTNFEEMVCFGYKERFALDNRAMEELHGQNQRIMQRILEGTYSDAVQLRSSSLGPRANADQFNFDLLQQSYQACMDTETLLKKGEEPVSKLVSEVMASWPLVSDLNKTADASDFDALAKVAMAAGRIGASPWGIGDAHADSLNPAVPLLIIGGITLLSTPEDDEEAHAKLVSTINATIPKIFPTVNETTALKLAEGMAAFEAEMAKQIAPLNAEVEEKIKQGADRVHTKLSRVPFSQLATTAPELRLDKLVLDFMPAGYTPEFVYLAEDYSWPYISAAIKKQPVAVLQVWFALRTASVFQPYTMSPEGEALTTTPRWQTCITAIDQQMRYALDRFYIQQTYTEQGRAAVTKMVGKIKTEFKNKLSKYSWMGEEAKKRAIKKVDNMFEEVGYQSKNPNIMNPDEVATYYSGLNITDDHFSNMLSANRQKMARVPAVFKTGYDKHEWQQSASTMNAAYSPWGNGITIFAGISRSPYFHSDLPQYALYGGLGTILGHEVTHGFDNSGSKYDEEGRFGTPWWDNATVEAYNKKAQCFVDQYDKMEVEVEGGKKEHANGKFTLGENLSDAAGIVLAYAAWEEERKSMPDVWDQSLPGLEEFTHEQLFFMMYANSWCSNTSPAANHRRLLTDEHAHASHRIQGVLDNSRAFKEAFKCQKKEPECELW